VTGAAAGTATISAAFSGLTASTEVTVSSLALGKMTPAAASLGTGGTLQFEALALFNDGRRQDITAQATWASDNIQVARERRYKAADAVGGSSRETQRRTMRADSYVRPPSARCFRPRECRYGSDAPSGRAGRD
jgi:hypothetical protein